MARNITATTGAAAISGKIGLSVESRRQGLATSGRQAAVATRRSSNLRIDGRASHLGLRADSGFRRGVDIKLNGTVRAGFARRVPAERSLIALSKQLVG